MDSREQFKKKPFGFSKITEGRLIRKEQIEKIRKQQRNDNFAKNRLLQSPEEKETKLGSVGELTSKLQQWKRDRDRRRKLEQLQKQPPFRAGTVHYNVPSQFKSDSLTKTGKHKKLCKQIHNKSTEQPKRISKVTEKRIKMKQLAVDNKRQAINMKTDITKSVMDMQTKNSSLINTIIDKISTSKKSPQNINIPLDNHDQQVPKSDTDISPKLEEPAYFSPYVVHSRGKDSMRKEQLLRHGIGRTSHEEVPTKDTVLNKLNISVVEEKRTAQYFKYVLNKETNRLKEVCNKWTEIKSDSDVTEEVQYIIHQTIGQTFLLINKKFQRFHRLVCDCETGKGQMLVTCKDLQGFWDMMYMEIKNCDFRFETLEKLRLRNWSEEEETKVVKATTKKKSGQRIKAQSTKPSALKAVILAARRNIPLNQNIAENIDARSNISVVSANVTSNISEMDCNAQKLRISDHRKSVSSKQKHTPMRRNTTLQSVQLSESSKLIQSLLTIKKVSQMCKTPEVQLDDTISYVNSDQTPSKSILKRTDELRNGDSHNIKSMHKVNFDDQVALNSIPVDEQAQMKACLSVASVKIDNFDFDNVATKIPTKVERKLNFENESFEEKENECNTDTRTYTNSNTDLSVSNVVMLRNLKKKLHLDDIFSPPHLMPSLNKTPKSVHRDYFGTRILRNRTVTIGNTPDSAIDDTNNIHEERESKIEKTPRFGRSRKSKSETIDQVATNNNFTTASKKVPRRSSRKSAKFPSDACMGCTPNKSIHSVTPHSERDRLKTTINLFERVQDVSAFSNGDLISWDSPKRVSRRTRRSTSNHKF